ncbi:MAG: PhoH family protein [Planctomycetes bacterium]|nr:PhoH family protein [Planctomycetota bacterium]
MRKTIELEDPEIARTLLGNGDCHLRRVRDALGLDIVVRREQLHLHGDDHSVDRGFKTFTNMLDVIRQSSRLEASDVDRILDTILEDGGLREPAVPLGGEFVAEALSGRPKSFPRGGALVGGRVRAQSPGQADYLEAIRTHDIVFAMGPAGSGKTYLAVAMAIEAMTRNLVNRLVLVRPAVEAGEHLGFLPGDLREKVNPYLRPLYDALHDLLNPQQVARFQERGVIEIAPLAFMRGRTLNNAFVILDEAQNTTPKQMKMFLTRLGRDARAVITGDITQVDLPDSERSGLSHARDVLSQVDGVAFKYLGREDIVRHPLVQRIVDAYEEREAVENGDTNQPERKPRPRAEPRRTEERNA